MINFLSLKPPLYNFTPVFWVIILLEYGPRFAQSPDFKVLESAEIIFVKDFDIIQPTYDPINSVKSPRTLLHNVSPHY
jgi:hypothetical protein